MGKTFRGEEDEEDEEELDATVNTGADAFDPSLYGEPGDVIKFLPIIPIEEPDETGHMWMVGGVPYAQGGAVKLYDTPTEARTAVGHDNCRIMVVNLDLLPIPEERLAIEEQLAQAERLAAKHGRMAVRLRDRIHLESSKCPSCDRYQRQGHNYCRMCGIHWTKGYTQRERVFAPFKAAERFCGHCGSYRKAPADCQSCG